MSRDVIPLFVADVSEFTKTLGKSLAQQDKTPGHAALLALISKAAGYRNHQHLKAEHVPEPLDALALKRVRRVFDAQGTMLRWPKWTKVQRLCLWPIWARMPAHHDLTEPELNALIKQRLGFDDHVLIRRSLIDHHLATRARDGSAYRRVEQRPSAEALTLIKELA